MLSFFQEQRAASCSSNLRPYFLSRHEGDQKGFFFSPRTATNKATSVKAGRALWKVRNEFRVPSDIKPKSSNQRLHPLSLRKWDKSEGCNFKSLQDVEWIWYFIHGGKSYIGETFRFGVILPPPFPNTECYHTCRRQKCTSMWYTPSARI